MLSEHTKRYLKWAGNVLSAVAVVFIGARLYSYQDQLDSRLISMLAGPVLVMSIVYGASCVLTALAWRATLRHLGCALDQRGAIHIYGVTQIAKYVPGNIIHLVGRQAKGVASGIPAIPLAKSMLWELALLSIAGALFCVLGLPLLLPKIGASSSFVVYVGILVMTYFAMSKWQDNWLGRGVILNSVFLAISGTLFVLLVWLISPEAVNSAHVALLICSAYVVAWLAGFITPGTPAGVGIRELVAYTLLQSLVAEPEILAAVVCSRVVSVLGDLLFFAFAQVLGRR